MFTVLEGYFRAFQVSTGQRPELCEKCVTDEFVGGRPWRGRSGRYVEPKNVAWDPDPKEWRGTDGRPVDGRCALKSPAWEKG